VTIVIETAIRIFLEVWDFELGMEVGEDDVIWDLFVGVGCGV